MEPANNNREEIFSKSVRAGKRTYFFDVKTTKANDLYLTITESKKRMGKDGQFYFEKHKIYLYKEDFEKFSEGLTEAVQKIEELKASGQYEPIEVESNKNYHNNGESTSAQNEATTSFSDVSFEDLGK
jgi:uncharacterized protein (DUF2344 family)